MKEYIREHQLYSSEDDVGKVVKHEYFILKDTFQGKKIVSTIHPKEIESYRILDFKEIHLDAAWDGLVVWKKMFFNFKETKDENFVKIAIQRYLREVKGMSLVDITKVIKSNPFSINPIHLKDTNPNNNFSSWVHSNCYGMGLAKMYKEL